MKTFKEFILEAYLFENQKMFSSREEGEKYYGSTPEGQYWNNAGSSENPKWRLKPKSGGEKERKARQERINSLSSEAERTEAERKTKHIQRKGYESHHITPTHHSAKIRSGMTDDQWQAQKEKDAKVGIYHGHHPKNLMATRGRNTPSDKPGVEHRSGGAHEIEGKVKDIVTGSSITHRDLMAAAIKRKRQQERKARLVSQNNTETT